jgi:adenylate cyclase
MAKAKSVRSNRPETCTKAPLEGAMRKPDEIDESQDIEDIQVVSHSVEDDLRQGMPISSAMVREQIETILSSPMFDASERNRRFLRYIVEETLADRGVRIKGYSVGISVFDREPSFDPQIDPVVRIEAGRLRRSLERYYLTDGRGASVRVSIPKGGYVPRFERMNVAEPTTSVADAATPSPNDLERSVIVLPFVSLSGDETGRGFAAGLSEELIVEFGKHGKLRVFALPAVTMGVDQDAPAALKKIAARLVLSGSVRISAAKLRVVAHLVDQVDNHHVWSASFDRNMKRLTLTDVEREIGHKIFTALMSRRGHDGWLVEKALDRGTSRDSARRQVPDTSAESDPGAKLRRRSPATRDAD